MGVTLDCVLIFPSVFAFADISCLFSRETDSEVHLFYLLDSKEVCIY